MLQICAVPVAAVLAMALSMAATASAKELKPKFGNIDGVYYSDVAGNREACRQAIRNKIALCRQNTNFESNTKNRKYKGCLPIFRRQAQSCVVHFRHQMSKCDLSGAARITDFTGFGCEATKTMVEDSGGPDIAPLDRRMRARTGSNLRAGPGTSHRIVGSLRTGQDVQVTGRTGDWFRIAAPGGGTAFVHGSLLVGAPPEQRRQSDGRTAPESARTNPALAAASRRCQAAASRANGAIRKARREMGRVLPAIKAKRCHWIDYSRNQARQACFDSAKSKYRRALKEVRAAHNASLTACCGSFRASSPGEKQMVSAMKHRCDYVKKILRRRRS